jgi:hypothetical protein
VTHGNNTVCNEQARMNVAETQAEVLVQQTQVEAITSVEEAVLQLACITANATVSCQFYKKAVHKTHLDENYSQIQI